MMFCSFPQRRSWPLGASWGTWRVCSLTSRRSVSVMWPTRVQFVSFVVWKWSLVVVLKAPPLASSTPVQRVEPTVVSSAKHPAPSAVDPAESRPPPAQPRVTTAKTKPRPKIILSTRNEPIGLNVDDFLLVSKHHVPGTRLTDNSLTFNFKINLIYLPVSWCSWKTFTLGQFHIKKQTLILQ